jgi:protocatechuate 3,4-dioxygenase beta subunit
MVGIGALVPAAGSTSAQEVIIRQAPPPPPPPMPFGQARDASEEKPGRGVVRGRVVAADTGAPIRKAIVRMAGSEIRGGRVASTDTEGRYEFREIPAGRFNLTVSKGGFVNLQYGQRRPFEPGKPLDLADGQMLEKIDFSLPRGSAITGRVVDEYGEPVAEAMVQAMRYQYVGGRRRLAPTGRMGQTNDLGQYRIYGLPPGDYYVSAQLRSVQIMSASMMGGGLGSHDSTGYASTYFPGTGNVNEAQRLTIGLGQEAMNIDFPLLPVRTAKVAGIVFDSEGKPVPNAMIMMMQTQGGGGAMFILGASASRTGKDGTFSMSNVAPGDYTLQVRAAPSVTQRSEGGGETVVMTTVITADGGMASSGPDMEYATVPLSVGGEDITGLAIVMSKGSRLTGRVVFEGNTPPRSQWESLRITAMNPEPDFTPFGGGGAGVVKEDGTFEVRGLSGSRLVRPAALPSGWTLKSVTLGGADVTDTPIEFKGSDEVSGLEIVLSPQVSQVLGGVTDERAQPIKDYTVIVFAANSARWGFQSRFIQSARPDQDGKFKIQGLPAEEYLAIAVDYVQAGEWQDPEFLERVKSRATSFTLADGETKGLDLKLTVVQ